MGVGGILLWLIGLAVLALGLRRLGLWVVGGIDEMIERIGAGAAAEGLSEDDDYPPPGASPRWLKSYRENEE